MYKVIGGISLGNNISHEFPVVGEAIDFADILWQSGFYYAEVMDASGSLEYSIQDSVPRTPEERNYRNDAAKLFIKLWNAKLEQNAAYATYARNISWSRELDAILSSAPGYLRRARG